MLTQKMLYMLICFTTLSSCGHNMPAPPQDEMGSYEIDGIAYRKETLPTPSMGSVQEPLVIMVKENQLIEQPDRLNTQLTDKLATATQQPDTAKASAPIQEKPTAVIALPKKPELPPPLKKAPAKKIDSLTAITKKPLKADKQAKPVDNPITPVASPKTRHRITEKIQPKPERKTSLKVAKIEKTLQKKTTTTLKIPLPDKLQAQLDSPIFTPLGAERKGNAEGTIPPWSGRMSGIPNGMPASANTLERPDPYAGEKPLFTITSDNVEQYASQLSEGQKKLFQKYPDSFYMHIYPSHREGRYNRLFEQRTAYNKKHTKLVNGIDGLRQYTGGIPFPLPASGAEIMWNARVAHPQSTIMGTFDDIAIYLNGNKQIRRQLYSIEFPFANPNNPIGKVDDEIGINAGLVHITIIKPERQKGQMIVVHESLDQTTYARKAWVYVPGSRRVRRAPTVGHDTPDGPGGLVTIDDSLGFNGAMERYNWKLLNKKEVFIPYHAYKFDSQDVDYDTLLESAHANPEFMRYELHRVWVVEANLKPGASHVYAKRRFYIDEDSWQIALLESYDGRGDLWRVGLLNTVYDYAVKGYVARAQMFHDLQTSAYITLRLTNETGSSNLIGQPKGTQYYAPANLRRMGTR